MWLSQYYSWKRHSSNFTPETKSPPHPCELVQTSCNAPQEVLPAKQGSTHYFGKKTENTEVKVSEKDITNPNIHHTVKSKHKKLTINPMTNH